MNVCTVENIKEEKKNKLKENIKLLEELENKFDENIKELKDIFQKIEKDKEDLKFKIINIFTKMRNALNEREDKLLKDIDNIYENNYFNEEIIQKGEKLPKQIKLSLEKGKLIDKEWDNDNIYSYINDCINIENNITILSNVKDNINKYKEKKKIKFEFIPQENSLNNFIDTLNTFRKIISNNFKFKECPNNINNNRAYVLSGENNNIMTKIGYQNWAGTICEIELDKSIEEHKWKIKILKTHQKAIMVGVAPNNFDIHSSSFENCGWNFYCYNSTLYSGPPFNYNNSNTNLSKVNDEIIVVMNMKKRTLKFIINNEDKGDSYSNLPINRPIYPTVFLYDINDSIEIIEI